jgi:two-component system, LytTR family, sensor kinase
MTLREKNNAMKYFPTRIRDISFWYYQITGWVMYSGLQFGLILGWREFQWQMVLALCINLTALFILLLGLRLYYRRLPFQTMTLLPLVSRIVVASFLTTILWLLLWAGVEYSVFLNTMLKYISSPVRIVSQLSFSFPIFLGWSALYFGIKAWCDWLNERDRTKQASEAAQRAQLQMLQFQLNPHFLFNTLNSVRALVDENTRTAKAMITDLSEFLRYSLMSRKRPVVPLKDELDAIRLYLSIEKMRYEDKLQVIYDIDRRTEDVLVPSFLVHPIIEYALRCGMQTSNLPLRLKINSGFTGSRLNIGILFSGHTIPANGTGTNEWDIEQVEARLKEFFPGQYRLSSSQYHDQVQILIELAVTNGAPHEEKVADNYR